MNANIADTGRKTGFTTFGLELGDQAKLFAVSLFSAASDVPVAVRGLPEGLPALRSPKEKVNAEPVLQDFALAAWFI